MLVKGFPDVSVVNGWELAKSDCNKYSWWNIFVQDIFFIFTIFLIHFEHWKWHVFQI